VALGARRDGTADKLIAEIEAMGRRAMGVQMDITRIEEYRPAIDCRRRAVRSARHPHQQRRVWAGEPCVDVTESRLRPDDGRQRQGTFFTSQAAGRVMIRQGGGRIVNLSSQAGFIALPTESIYCASKAAVAH
jgi:NAD(P)-dependent dehydrogenase (short-subunit alcohol dehydrogenase family)